jgi:hypothetical protein
MNIPYSVSNKNVSFSTGENVLKHLEDYWCQYLYHAVILVIAEISNRLR